MSESWYPKAVRLPITTKEYWAPRPRPLVSIVNHITDGTDSRSYLQNANNGSSVHFLVREENGQGVVYQFMPVEWAAWGNGTWSENNPYMPDWVRALLPDLRANPPRTNINYYTVSIEHERKWPFNTTLPASMKAATIELQKWLCDTFPTIVPDREHIIGHYQVDMARRPNCPGGPGGALFPFDDIIASLKPAQPQPDTYTDPVTGFSISHGFLRYWEANQRLGHPLSNEESGDSAPWSALPELSGYVCQRFERGFLHWRMGEQVQEGRAGALIGALAA